MTAVMMTLLILLLACQLSMIEGWGSFFFGKNGATTSAAAVADARNVLIPKLNELIDKSDGGVDDSYNDEIQSLMVEISSKCRTKGDDTDADTDQRQFLSGTWELIYTTEKEINFFKTSWPFAKVTSIIQNMDLYENGIVDNVINFSDGDAQFRVTGTVQAVDDNKNNNDQNDVNDNDEKMTAPCYDRVEFEFTKAVAKVWGQDINLPPVGTGWFDTMYCENDIRLSKDSRNDWSIFRRM